ncbi:EF-hand domain-containing protein [Actibacterium sp. D379-3]
MKRTSILTPLTALSIGAALALSALPAAAQNAMPAFEKLDTNGNGTLSAEEFQAPMEARFAAIDTNGDGALSVKEMQDARAAGGAGGGMLGDRLAWHEPNPQQREERAARMMEHLDQNGDALLSFEELSAMPASDRIFDRIDTDASGSISRDEFEAAKAEFAEFRKNRQSN